MGGDSLIEEKLLNNALFQGMDPVDVDRCIRCSQSIIKEYDKKEMIFTQLDHPSRLFVLLDGTVSICRDNILGNRTILSQVQANDVFGEAYLFTEDQSYDYYAIAATKVKILEVPKNFFYKTCGNACSCHSSVIYNMLGIYARKTNLLNHKVQILSSGSLRQKIARYLEESRRGNQVKLTMNREELADYLNVARPSLSRELIKMQQDGMIKLDRNLVTITDTEALSECL